MPRLTEQAHAAVRAVLAPGEAAADATCGNGRDTRFLADLVSPAGRVFAFDVQPVALQRTAQSIAGRANVSLIECDHAHMLDAIPAELHGRVGTVMFNLGYLPGGDKTVVTTASSTILGLRAALELLREGGVLTVIAYPGHPGGAEETDAVEGLLRSLPTHFEARVERAAHDRPDAPRLYLVHKRLHGG